MLTFGFFLLPLSEHSFIVEATKKLYLAKTTNEKLFQEEGKLDVEKMIKNKSGS